MNKRKQVYLVGIKGVAMTALAVYFKQQGIAVSGCDTEEHFPTDDVLAEARISVFVGFDPEAIPANTDLVVYTGAHGGKDNPVVVKAHQQGIQTLPHGQALGMVMDGMRQVVVAGSHGKTTISSMIATVLLSAAQDPSYAIGCGGITGVGLPGRFGRGPWFVAEGDEYVTDPGHDTTPRFLWTKPEILVVSNIDFDHPDAYADISAVQQAFVKLQQQQVDDRLTIVNRDNTESEILLSGGNVVTYGFSPRADVRITHVSGSAGKTFFTLEKEGITLGEFSLQVPGRHNVSNAAAAVAALIGMGIRVPDIQKGLAKFQGTKRRFEKIAEEENRIYYDDYAHHPAEIKATLSAARMWYPDHNIVAVFQPHTYSRTKALLSEFARSFTDANMVLITDIYASAREHDTLGITAETLSSEVKTHHAQVVYTPGMLEIKESIAALPHTPTVVMFMGAGDIYGWEKETIISQNK
jgi:UDP-N-acetylmuramate--alanine ligase